MSDELKPCPFCGGKIDKPKHDPDYSYGNDLAPWKLLHRCADRWRGTITFNGETKQEAITAWNTRTDERAEMQAAIVELRVVLNKVLKTQVRADDESFITFSEYYHNNIIVNEIKTTLNNTKKWGA